jgi:hypothetical protein
LVRELTVERDQTAEHLPVRMRLATVKGTAGTKANVVFGGKNPDGTWEVAPTLSGVPCFSAVKDNDLVVVLTSGNLAVVLGPAEGKV